MTHTKFHPRMILAITLLGLTALLAGCATPEFEPAVRGSCHHHHAGSGSADGRYHDGRR